MIITAYNVENYLQRAVKSVLSQTFTDFELLVVDDGSTDNTVTVAKSLANNDNRVKIILQSNQGVATARNNGINHARGEYIQFVDADDVVSSNFLADINVRVQRGVDVLISDYRTFSGNVADAKDSYFRLRNAELTGLVATQFLFLNLVPNFSWAFCVRRQIYLGNDLKFPAGRIFEDNSLYYRLLFVAESVKICDLKNYYYFQRRDSYVHVYSQRSIKDLLVMLNEVEVFARQHGGKIASTSQEYLIKRYFKAYTMCVVGYDGDDNSALLAKVNHHIKTMKPYRPRNKKMRLKKLLWQLGILKPVVLFSNRHLGA
ncbi:hypothetical protein FD19_GL000079 [Lacticaseibacillus thailandensis DSM 22698 = JCM 13996]|uniref:Glycosyltransferase 2-like domain-containing protein n=1 Tax=Lacticaseibacillus thailandensis DSM 22698 = JCM 13996 TaxID=1423810 RepID=A0A0R2CHB4_9LACO|nr:hypothetical protein FD19_GL000079 [Lacticaseibacillus thailandensis DSM 22698 = JCM 13996]